MTQAADRPEVYRFQDWELRPRERLLLVRGEPAKIGSRAFDLLVALAERCERVVAKAELLDAAWPGLVVEENNLSVQITALRKLLGAGAIVNVSGLGYRLAAALPARGGPALGVGAGLPAALELIGREADLAALLTLLQQAPLVSVVGTGGVGKTVLARAALAHMPKTWRDGAHWVDLAPLRPGAPLIQVLARKLGIHTKDFERPSADLVLALSRLDALVVLDNCEHLIEDIASLLAPLLEHAQGLRWLATSQEPLRLHGEVVYRLRTLPVPPIGTPPDDALASTALSLFEQRARAGDDRFTLGGQERELALEVCRQLDGLPLAIEMAAARVATLGLDGLRDQLDQRLRLKAGTRNVPQRHHTLLQTFEWSYGLLDPIEQTVFRYVEPFSGGFTVALAQRLCATALGAQTKLEPWQVLDALSALVDKSLVQQDATAGGAARLRLLESAREYARLRQHEAGETDAVQLAHAEVVAWRFDDAHADLRRQRDADWAAHYGPERQNVCSALAWVCAHPQPDLLAQLVAALSMLDGFAYAQAEVLRYPVSVPALHEAKPVYRARAYGDLAWAHFLDGSREAGTELALLALADYEQQADNAGQYLTLVRLMRLYAGRPGHADEVQAMWRRLQRLDDSGISVRDRLFCQGTAAVMFRSEDTIEQIWQLRRIANQAGFDGYAAVCSVNVTDQLLIGGNYEAVFAAEQTVDEAQPWPRMRAMIFHNRALALVRAGRVDEARVAARVTLRALPSAAHMLMDVFALAAAQEGQFEDAALLAGCGARIKRELDRHPEAAEAAAIRQTHEQLSLALGASRLEHLMGIGAQMTTADAMALALAEPSGSCAHAASLGSTAFRAADGPDRAS